MASRCPTPIFLTCLEVKVNPSTWPDYILRYGYGIIILISFGPGAFLKPSSQLFLWQLNNLSNMKQKARHAETKNFRQTVTRTEMVHATAARDSQEICIALVKAPSNIELPYRPPTQSIAIPCEPIAFPHRRPTV